MATNFNAGEKTFYLETFGCQMNVHDSEKVIGTLVQQGYQQVQEETEASLILYNTCSIRDKAEQKRLSSMCPINIKLKSSAL